MHNKVILYLSFYIMCWEPKSTAPLATCYATTVAKQ